MSTFVVIPARLGSTRLPRKVLADICGKPLIQHVWEQVNQCQLVDEVLVAVDSPEVMERVISFGGKAIMSSESCENGTNRISSIAGNLNADLVINVQGDEPLVSPEMIDRLIEAWRKQPTDLVTPVFKISSMADLVNPNIVKVARAADGRVLYFSRSAIPYLRDQPQDKWLQYHTYWGHIGVYGYRKQVLLEYSHLPYSPLQRIESLEQLRFLEAGFTFQTVETDYRSLAIDTAEDLDAVRKLICRS